MKRHAMEELSWGLECARALVSWLGPSTNTKHTRKKTGKHSVRKWELCTFWLTAERVSAHARLSLSNLNMITWGSGGSYISLF